MTLPAGLSHVRTIELGVGIVVGLDVVVAMAVHTRGRDEQPTAQEPAAMDALEILLVGLRHRNLMVSSQLLVPVTAPAGLGDVEREDGRVRVVLGGDVVAAVAASAAGHVRNALKKSLPMDALKIDTGCV
jgi:hypothetical protein